ncbi:hypothetical protein P175DRAFT_0455913 [Aspergillus ochraceoroseus IBT 24754]|uniref:Alpha/beta hydrolase fold-3 domain-containing protein n=2 Tax=Aspergillus ochraceoroseus TaxID=138278 RepID=A0A2T5LYP6_9EURO|nr:uncharacterized protein P175DRAFT_0455913 [Aspergillus ochraceoroseus IBT 24754]KKK12071.1 hypothetical protein AOCH_003751 [Aspergillus ochraceoroseus]PTU21399.1 hypothetical protein P175DRAFT_0455913 [Aspergillus ochraceoroseus IBT 24754]
MSALGSPIAILMALLIRIPLIVRTILLHSIRQSPATGKQDLRTELTVTFLRSFMNGAVSISKQQKRAMRDPGIKGPLWVSKVKFPQPELDDVQEAVIKAIEELKLGGETFDLPGVVPVEAEWTGYRRGVGKNAPQPEMSEEQKYAELKKESREDMVILYFHGGAYYLMDPCTHRLPTSQLSKRTGAPVLSIRYRLAPQHPFPAALVDALVAYLSLISPPPGSLHAPVPANKIVLAGDSAGGNLSLVLLQTLLTLHRTSHRVRFHGRDIPIEPPAGVATSSPWCDLTRSMPSVFSNAKFDYLPPPKQTPETAWVPPSIPADDIWPTSPPRVDYFVNADAILHPLVSPLAAPKHLWKDAPPILISTGEEGLSDEDLILARRMHQGGAPVVVEQFEGMPHCFGLVFPGTSSGSQFFDRMAKFCRDAVAGKVTPSGKLSFIGFKATSNREIPLPDVSPLTDEEVDQLLQTSAEWRMQGEMELRKQWVAKAKL